jgi:hypothetical protein
LDHRRLKLTSYRSIISKISYGVPIAMLYKERWSIEKWWRWLKRIYKVKEPLGESENALPLQIVAAFVTDLVLRAFKHSGGFKGALYDFVKTCREIALIPISGVIGGMRQALEAALYHLGYLKLYLKRKLDGNLRVALIWDRTESACSQKFAPEPSCAPKRLQHIFALRTGLI